MEESGDYTPPVGKSQVKPEQTNLAEAIRMAAAVFPPDTAKRIVILSDGNETGGEALAEAKRVSSADIGIDVVPLDYSYAREVQVTNLWAPPMARVGDEIPLKISLLAQGPARGQLVLTDNGKPIVLDPQTGRDSIPVELQPGRYALICFLPDMKDGTTINVRDLIIPGDVTLMTDGDEIVAKLQAPRVEEAPVVAEVEIGEGAPAEGGEAAESTESSESDEG
jgi:hypothetical protein